MPIQRAIKALCMLCACACSLSSAFAGFISDRKYKPNELIVKYRDDIYREHASIASIYSIAKAAEVKGFRGQIKKFERLILSEGSDLRRTMETLRQHPAVEYVQPNYIIRALPVAGTFEAFSLEGMPVEGKDDDDDDARCGTEIDEPGCDIVVPCLMANYPVGCGKHFGGFVWWPSFKKIRRPIDDRPAEVTPGRLDPRLNKLWAIDKIEATKAWQLARGSQRVVVAVIDTGIDYNHEDLNFNIWRNPHPDPEKNDVIGWDFVHNDNLPYDDNLHGTHVAGTIGAVGRNGKGVSGVAQRISLMPVKFLDAAGIGDTATAVEAVEYAVAHGAKIINASWGGPAEENDKLLEDAIRNAHDKGVLFVAAAGNDGKDNDVTSMAPAAFDLPNVISVAATDEKDELASFSNFGLKTVHLAAPGKNIYSTLPGNRYGKLSGTSMAAPQVTGAAALVWAANPRLTVVEVKKRLIDSAEHVVPLSGKTISGSRLDVLRALR